MKSAYSVLGVPGNATTEDIDEALARARATYTPERIATDSRVAEQLSEAFEAHKVLRDAEMRAAHDRKLARQGSEARVPPRIASYPDEVRESRRPSLATIGIVLVVALFAGGYYMERQRREANAQIALQQLETARQQAAAEAENRRTVAIEADERRRKDSDDRMREQQFQRESEVAIARAQNAQDRQRQLQAQQFASEQREEQRKESERRADEQRRVSEGQRRVAIDRQRVRELCYINYRRYDC